MGRKRARARQLVYFFAAGLVLSCLFSCMPDMKRIAFKKEMSVRDTEESKDSGDGPWESLQRARTLFAQGNYEASLEENRKVLAWAEEASPGDKALFNMGLIYANGANPKKDLGKSLIYFRRVSEEYPRSPLADEARVWSSLLQKCMDLKKDVVDLTQENVAVLHENKKLAQENVAILQENTKMSQILEKTRQMEESAQGTRDIFQRTRKSFEQGTYESLLEENQKILSAPAKNTPKDRALFQIGLIYAHTGNPKRDLEKSLSFFQRLLKEYPQSLLADESKTLMDMIQENLKLNQMIEKSKQVDISIEEKKREKGR